MKHVTRGLQEVRDKFIPFRLIDHAEHLVLPSQLDGHINEAVFWRFWNLIPAASYEITALSYDS